MVLKLRRFKNDSGHSFNYINTETNYSFSGAGHLYYDIRNDPVPYASSGRTLRIEINNQKYYFYDKDWELMYTDKSQAVYSAGTIKQGGLGVHLYGELRVDDRMHFYFEQVWIGHDGL